MQTYNQVAQAMSRTAKRGRRSQLYGSSLSLETQGVTSVGEGAIPLPSDIKVTVPITTTHVLSHWFERFLSSLLHSGRRSGNCPDYLQQSQAGEIAIKWLRSTQMDNTMGFLANQRLVKSLIEVLVATGHHEIVSSWYQKTNEELEKVKIPKDLGSLRARVFLEYIKAETTLGRGPKVTMEVFLNFLNKSRAIKSDEKMTLGSGQLRALFGLPGHYLMRHLFENFRTGEITLPEFDRFADSVAYWSKGSGFESAWLALHHPSRLDPQPTLSYLKHLSEAEYKKLPPHRRVANTELALRAAERFMEQEKSAKAFRIMNVIKEHFSEEVGLVKAKKPTPPMADMESQEQDRIYVQILDHIVAA